MIRILVLAEHFPNRVQPWLLNWLVESVNQGCSINIIANDVLGDTWQDKVNEYGFLTKTEYYSIESPKEVFKRIIPFIFPVKGKTSRSYKGLFKILSSGMPNVESLREIMRVIACASAVSPGEYDIIHSHTLGMSYRFLFIKDTLKIPLVTTFHGLPPAGVAPLKKSKMLRVFQTGELFLVNTNFAKHQLASLGCPEEKIQLLPQGINLDDFPYHPKPFTKYRKLIVITVGRFHKDKGHIYAIDAVAHLLQQGIDVEYRIIGVGPEKQSLLDYIHDKNLGNNIFILESLDDDALRAQYQEANIFVLPSIRDVDGVHEETQGVVLQEAQASGLLVIATKTGGIPECVTDNVNAFLVDDRNAEQISEKIKYLVLHKEQWQTWQNSARKFVEETFSIRVLGKRLVDLYGKLIDKNKESRLARK